MAADSTASLTVPLPHAYDRGCAGTNELRFSINGSLIMNTSLCVVRRHAAFESMASHRQWTQRLAGAVAFFGLGLLAAGPASALTPESPEVKAVVTKAVKYLETVQNTGFDEFPGAKALVAMCILKQYGEAAQEHPKVLEAVQAIRDGLQKGLAQQQMIYNTGICLLFLLELDRIRYRSEMEQLLALQLSNQIENGGWDYTGIAGFRGDISVSQYAVLGLWACQMAEIPVPIERWDRAANWLLRVQDPSGGYGYKAKDPGNSTRVDQPEVRVSLSAAGLGSVCICAYSALGPAADEPQENGPPQLKKVVKAQPVRQRSKNINLGHVKEALALGKGYFSKNYTPDYKMHPDGYMFYYMYAMERYKSFLAEIQPNEKDDNKWYDDGYALLAKTQSSEGSWRTSSFGACDTCFAVLFLMRSTKKIIETAKTFGGGLLTGGRGLPENSADILIAPGGIRSKPLKGPAMDLLQKLAPDDPHMEEVLRGLEGQSLVEEGDRLSEVQKRLRSMMAQAKTPEAKAAALKLLGRTRNLDDVPILIEALKDPDPVVFLAATDALRFLARKFGDAGFFGVDEKGRKAAIEKWKTWYLEIRPDAQFPESDAAPEAGAG